ncbi:probable phytol kinase 3, chloroplastic isoform X2 [Durio zibethinus]|uniref:Probable phytol kinase 3, chloroplastic isoform X2 n=1 Tax=Durio zibethinus TaxID=66656 RepID=A0A6P5XU99_DURZI|nr:probable phytol kinase 3, chloroplastic isoform X2 [Durio zibethinus]
MAVVAVPFFPSTILKLAPKLSSFIFDIHVSPAFSSFSLAFSATNCNNFTNRFTFRLTNPRKLRRNPRPPSAAMIFPQNPKLNRKLVHISIGLVFMLCWPLFSSGYRGAILAAITPGVNIIRMLLIGSGIWKDEATVKSMSRYGDYRELLKGPLYYATTITLACAVYWRTSPIAIAAICNLCAGDGLADVVGRRFGRQKLPYNRNKSIAGSVAMATAGFLTSVGYMYYFSYFGYIQESWEIVLGFLVVSLASALVESLPISTELDDNLTVTLTSILVGTLVF